MEVFYIHPDNPQPRLIEQAADLLRRDQLIIYPTDTSYAFGCRLGAKDALAKLKQIRELDDKHQFTLLCRDLSEIANYATVDNVQFKQLKAHTPAPITFILNATKDVPKKLAHAKKKTIGIRVPSNPIAQALLEAMDEPILTSSLILPNRDDILDDPFEIEDLLGNQIDGLINVGIKTTKLTTIVDMTSSVPEVIRQGAANVDSLLL
ncbi:MULTISPECIES: L-threonylcarbamoyladenylate synthase [unclassified Psychrobacter]|jgi:tRNA threonylcarbamoyl adenosine modification protein (Sua5/YciO/YrdC/YwlC family)|uniref:L-threonylcarbamoyladenylate synthase n=1 Tax=unclassified Psychrobacter TaxID=196806 RepID=UPI000C33A876|nr:MULTISPECIES: L-threonylcarbamoyladenylate synthase [unclassified Psychrobacter]MBA6243649.1 threonylcarbamoyl-AMP synthase [Psychrobacter sp. Urea-trap-18]MBA6286793.1 threonylcarbamoyl-AMP synthase [Psychrobacter sp. Urea-trap-16]MBA6317492.1 threonylcarbamoyl-AMP synthase [Psychrobacter sp. Urea-trap-20]MBA6333347.1 threonylcarbamoyl-AMP synthase [Psychrobacter sp. Urea-trap-19]PKG61122.1 threonylcarbamoyl-AMP synthase [Psychrobacter sp. Choline-3u-12]